MFASSCLFAQKTEADIRARLVKKPLFLRGQWASDKLAFDDAGHVQGASGPTSFTLAGVEIGSVKLTSSGLVLDGQRMGLEFNKDVPKQVRLWNVTIKIQTPTDGDFTTALDAIFTDSIATLNLPLPWCWQQYAHEHLLPAGTPFPAVQVGGTSPSGAAKDLRADRTSSMPRLTNQVKPELSAAARALNYSGIVLINFVVEKDGIPSHIRVLHAAGLGLDELAVVAVSRYTFQPAMEYGKPVAVEMNVEVNFQVR